MIQHVRRTRKPELCTQAWCKFHEIVASFPILPLGVRRVVAPPGDGPKPAEGASVPTLEEEGVLRSVHLCEAPGAFIASLNHYLKTRGMLYTIISIDIFHFELCVYHRRN